MEDTQRYYIIILIIIIAGVFGGLTNFFMSYNSKLNSKENWIKFFACILLSLCASMTVPLFLQSLSSNILDRINFNNSLIFLGFCVLASYYSKRFLEDVYSKLNNLDKKLDETKKVTESRIENVTQRTDIVVKKVEDLEEAEEEIEEDDIPTEIKDSISTYKKGVLGETELENIVRSLASTKYSFRTLEGISKATGLGKERVREILDHLVEHGFSERKVGSHGKDIWRILKYPIRIYSATYVWPSGQVDVTDAIKGLAAKGIYQGTVDPSTFGIPDPAYGVIKTLKIHCRIHGKEKELPHFKDGQTFKIE